MPKYAGDHTLGELEYHIQEGSESMIITRIEEQKKNKKRSSIFVDNEYYCSIDKDILGEICLSEGRQLNEEEFSRIMETIQYKDALRAALYMLTRSSKTENEVRKKLREKQYSEKSINQVLKYLEEINYVNDTNYTESYVRSMRDTKGISRKSLYYKLVAKGIDSDIIQQVLDEAGINDYDSALKIAQKKAITIKGDKREKASKLLSFLYRKGYEAEICRKVIEELDWE